MRSRPELIEVPCDTIQVVGRHRKDLGDLKALADIIGDAVLDHPVLITNDGYIICGERRLRAAHYVLGRKMIQPPSERVAIAKAVEAEIVNRNRQRKDPGFRHHARTIAAAKAGFDCEATYLLAKRVVDTAVAEVIEKMDAGEITIAGAALIALQPPEKQRELANMPRPSHRFRKLRSARSYIVQKVVRAIATLAETKYDPVELASRTEHWIGPVIRAKTPIALEWLKRLEEEIGGNTQVSR